MPYDERVLLHETLRIVILWLLSNEYIVSLFQLALSVCHCGMQKVMVI